MLLPHFCYLLVVISSIYFHWLSCLLMGTSKAVTLLKVDVLEHVVQHGDDIGNIFSEKSQTFNLQSEKTGFQSIKMTTFLWPCVVVLALSRHHITSALQIILVHAIMLSMLPICWILDIPWFHSWILICCTMKTHHRLDWYYYILTCNINVPFVCKGKLWNVNQFFKNANSKKCYAQSYI